MKINKFKKLGAGRYNIIFDNTDITVYEDIILKYDLLIKKDIDVDLIDKIIEENNYYEAYHKALSYIEIKMRNKKEIIDYLKRKEYSNEIIYDVLNKLDKLGLLNDKKYIAIINKCDLPKKIDDEYLENKVYISATENINIDGLKDKIKELFNLEQIETEDLTYLTSARSIAILNKVEKEIKEVLNGINEGFTLDMVEIDLKSIWNLLGEIIGENYSDELLDTLFSNFCVGK